MLKENSFVVLFNKFIKDEFPSGLHSLSNPMFKNVNSRWNVNRCYSLRNTYFIFEAFQILFPTASLILTAVKLFHQLI